MTPAVRRVGAVLVLATLTVGVTACGSDDKPDTVEFKACGLVDDATASTAVGAQSVASSDESKDMNGPASNILSCRYTPKGDGPSLVFLVTQASSEAKATSDIEATQKTCATAQPLDVDEATGFVCSTGDLGGGPQAYATWDGYVVKTALTESNGGPSASAATTGLAGVVEKLHQTLTATSFDAH